MQKLSALIFCRDDPSKVVSLVDHLSDVCDQIVLVDSSTKRNFERLKARLSSLPKGRVDLYRTLALGYPDPLRAYGLGKCKYDWVLYIDTDERINSELKRDIRRIISKPRCDAFAIKRYENAHLDGKNDGYFTWQIRLYNKNRIYYRGLLHEQPIVKGTMRKLADKYSMLHVVELKTKGTKRRDLEYSLIKKYYDRLSYSMLNERMKEYLEKMMLPEKEVEETTIGKIVLGWMKFYQTVTMRKMHNEISALDYFIFFSMIEGAYVMKRKDIVYLFGEAIPTVLKDTSSASKFKRERNSREIFEISKEVNRHGIIRYLMLDKERIVDKLYSKYKNEKQGITLLMKLLEDRYKGDYP